MAYTGAPSLSYSGLGIVQDGDTASRAISKDAYVIWKGGNYFAKTDILQGATFVVDSNLTAIPDGVVNGIAEKARGWTFIGRYQNGAEFTVLDKYQNLLFVPCYYSSSKYTARISAICPISFIEDTETYSFEINTYVLERNYANITKVSTRKYRIALSVCTHCYVYAQ